jgi:hypothetical protein
MIERLSEEYRQAVVLVNLEELKSARGCRETRAFALWDESRVQWGAINRRKCWKPVVRSNLIDDAA